jgi:hypothetical protein
MDQKHLSGDEPALPWQDFSQLENDHQKMPILAIILGSIFVRTD